jgi:hypothetical protein
MRMRRRTLIGGAAAWAALGALSGPGRAQADAAPDLWISAGQSLDAANHVAGVASDGALRFSQPLPARGHATAVRPGGREAVICARRPGDFAAVIDLAGGRIRQWITASSGRHFYGHGAFSADGRRFFATENAFDSGDGRIGLYDAAEGYRRIGEWPSGGIGPHDLRLLPDGHTLAVANGGIRTHPGTGREALNLDSMAPSLVLLDTRDGRRVVRFDMPAALHRLSLRHLAIGAGGAIGAVMQYQGPAEDLPPLVAIARRKSEGLRFFEAPAPVLQQMANYCGSAAFDRSGTILGVSSPRGHLFTFWSADGALIGTAPVTDGCGIAADTRPGRFLLSSGITGLWRFDLAENRLARLTAATDPIARWDNHMTLA